MYVNCMEKINKKLMRGQKGNICVLSYPLDEVLALAESHLKQSL